MSYVSKEYNHNIKYSETETDNITYVRECRSLPIIAKTVLTEGKLMRFVLQLSVEQFRKLSTNSHIKL